MKNLITSLLVNGKESGSVGLPISKSLLLMLENLRVTKYNFRIYITLTYSSDSSKKLCISSVFKIRGKIGITRLELIPFRPFSKQWNGNLYRSVIKVLKQWSGNFVPFWSAPFCSAPLIIKYPNRLLSPYRGVKSACAGVTWVVRAYLGVELGDDVTECL